MDALRTSAQQFADTEDGGLTIQGLLLFVGMATVAAAALDVSFLLSSRTHLQVAADSAAHAALYLRDITSESEAISGAQALVETQFPKARFGTVLDANDITFGIWDHASGTFTADSGSASAVHVMTGQTSAHMNPVETFLFRFVGIDSFDVAADAVFATYRPPCMSQGFAAEGRVDIQSNNTFTGGFCMHSNDHISLNSNNVFEEGSVVSMPDINDIDQPSAGWDANPGLKSALRYGSYRMRLINRLEDLVKELRDGDKDVIPDYIDNNVPIYLSGTRFEQEDFTPGRIHLLSCAGGYEDDDEDDDDAAKTQKITINTDVLLSEVVLVTNCDVTFSEGVVLEDASVATFSRSVRSMTAPSGLQVGRDDGCAPGGGAQLLTMGGMDFAAALTLFGAQLIADGDISFSASAEGIQGVSMVAGGEISGTSNMAMGYCATGMEDNFEEAYFRLVH